MSPIQTECDAVTDSDACALEASSSAHKSDCMGDGAQVRTQPVTFEIRPKSVTRFLLTFVTVISVTGTLANYLIFQVFSGPEHRVSRLLNRFDLGHEPSIPAFYSSFALLLAAVLLAVIAIGERRRNVADWTYWAVLALLFAGMSLDEMVMFHEMFVNSLRDSFQLRGILYFSWVIPGLITVAVVGICYLKFLLRLDAITRRLFILAASLFVGGAIGMEMIAGIVVERHGVASIGHLVVQTIEETCEMVGVVVFIYALLSYVEKQWGGFQLTFLSSPKSRRSTQTH